MCSLNDDDTLWTQWFSRHFFLYFEFIHPNQIRVWRECLFVLFSSNSFRNRYLSQSRYYRQEVDSWNAKNTHFPRRISSQLLQAINWSGDGACGNYFFAYCGPQLCTSHVCTCNLNERRRKNHFLWQTTLSISLGVQLFTEEWKKECNAHY